MEQFMAAAGLLTWELQDVRQLHGGAALTWQALAR
jgi:hypothetical protein